MSKRPTGRLREMSERALMMTARHMENEMRTLAMAYRGQRYHAQQRGIEFKLTFDEWLAIWKRSKRLPQRGCRRGQYVMARFNDAGAYEVGNVKIVLMETNMREANSLRVYTPHSEQTKKKISQMMMGQKRPGVSLANKRRKMENKR